MNMSGGTAEKEDKGLNQFLLAFGPFFCYYSKVAVCAAKLIIHLCLYSEAGAGNGFSENVRREA
jgi:hypothetical protein